MNPINLTIISFFLVRIASFTIPFIGLGIYSHYIYRLINIFIIFFTFFFLKKSVDKKFFNGFTILSFLYVVSQGLSVFGAVNFRVFLLSFEKVVSSFLFLLALYPLFKQNGKKIINVFVKIIIVTSAINIFIQLAVIIAPVFSITALSKFIHPGIIDIMINNYTRGRIYFEFYDEASIPILFYSYFANKNNRFLRVFSLVLLFLIIFVSFFSNIRTRFLVTVVALIGCFALYRDLFSKNAVKIISVLIGVFIIVFVGQKLVTSDVGFSVIDRFLLEDKAEDSMTISFRLNMLEYSIDMGNSHPLFGVGLGNFYEYMPSKIKNQSFLQTHTLSALLYPHNIFAQAYAESGIVGLLSLCFLFGYMILKDIRIFKNGPKVAKAISLSFWSLFIFSLLNPPTPLTFFANFIVLRTLLEL